MRLGEIFTLQAGKFVKASDISETKGISTFPCYGGHGLRGYVNKYNREGEFPIIGRQGALCGNVIIANGQFYATEHAVVVETHSNTNVFWSYYFLQAINLNQYSTATAQPGLAVANINQVFIPVPPLVEQKRIVDVIGRVMPFVEQYILQKRQLNTLNKQLPDALRKSIIQEAIKGKLVPQDDTEEPASVLLERIVEERAKLGKKAAKPMSRIVRRGSETYLTSPSKACVQSRVTPKLPSPSPP